jgi:uncharacterized membrane protein YgcG
VTGLLAWLASSSRRCAVPAIPLAFFFFFFLSCAISHSRSLKVTFEEGGRKVLTYRAGGYGRPVHTMRGLACFSQLRSLSVASVQIDVPSPSSNVSRSDHRRDGDCRLPELTLDWLPFAGVVAGVAAATATINVCLNDGAASAGDGDGGSSGGGGGGGGGGDSGGGDDAADIADGGMDVAVIRCRGCCYWHVGSICTKGVRW